MHPRAVLLPVGLCNWCTLPSMDLTSICRAAAKQGASDIHLKADRAPAFRINGVIVTMEGGSPVSNEQLTRMAWDIMSASQRDRFKAALDLDMGLEVDGVGRFRVNVFRQRHKMGLVLRVIPTQVQSIDELGLPEVIKEIATQPRGLILVTGTTGSGKTTTLAAMIEEINRRFPHHIVTIEDPIEFSFKDRKSVISQREVGTDTQTFTSGLRAVLRQDPDVILVGELRDKETVKIALDAAETGHLVLSTLHTLDAAESINRIVAFFEPHHQSHVRLQLSTVLQAVLSQRLVQTLRGTRVAAVEIMRNMGVISECIADPARLHEIPDYLARNAGVHGTQSFDQAVFKLLQGKHISKEQALRSVNNPDELELRLQGIEHGFQ
jgi:twitching motility protein PilT